ncbi:MAG: sigma-70 family RNA polymerase sigma factor [Sphingomonas sp.]|nr:sigma-70 family RNA polymerase sigma factor [Sphingomonas sp.]
MSLSRPDAAHPISESADEVGTGRVRQLYRDHSSSLVRQLTRKTGCGDLARDVAHETFLGLLRMAPEGLERIRQPEAYLWRVSTRLLGKWGTSKALRERGTPTLEVIADPLVDQVATLEQRDTLRRLEHAVEQMKPRTREIFLAHRVDGLSYTEIAERMGLSVKGVEKQMSKAIAKIDRLLDRG